MLINQINQTSNLGYFIDKKLEMESFLTSLFSRKGEISETKFQTESDMNCRANFFFGIELQTSSSLNISNSNILIFNNPLKRRLSLQWTLYRGKKT